MVKLVDGSTWALFSMNSCTYFTIFTVNWFYSFLRLIHGSTPSIYYFTIKCFFWEHCNQSYVENIEYRNNSEDDFRDDVHTFLGGNCVIDNVDLIED